MRRQAFLLLGLVACAERSGSLVAVQREESPTRLRLVLTAQPGARINARLKPALELADGSVLHFDATRLSPDSAYFAEPPALEVPRHTPTRGRLRASVCPAGEKICRLVVLEVS